jgi:hypothetical protein
MRTVVRIALMLLGLLTVCGISIEAKAQSPTSAPQPSAEIQTLTKALMGEWSLSVKFEPSPSAPKNLSNTGEETWRPGPGGFTLLEEEHLHTPEAELFLLGILWWDPASKSFHGMECQNLLPYTCDVKGAQNDITMNWDGKQFIIDEVETSTAGKKSIWHEVWSDITSSSFTQTGEYGEPGGPRKRLFTIHAARVTKAQSKNDTATFGDQLSSRTADPAPALQSLEKALTDNWSTSYDIAPSGMPSSGGEGQ